METHTKSVRVDRFRFQIVSAFVKKATSTRGPPPPPPQFKNPSSLRVGEEGRVEKWNVLQVISRSAVVHQSTVHQRLGFTKCQVFVFVFSDFLTQKTVQSIAEIDFSLNLVNGVKILPYFP